MPTSLANREMTALIDRLAPAEGLTASILDGVRLFRSTRVHPRTPTLYEPCIVIVCQGRKIGYLGGQVFPYDPDHFLLLTLPMPFESETIASPEEPLLGVAIPIDLGVTAELAHLLELPALDVAALSDGITSAKIDAALADSVVRLLRALERPAEARAL
ncbi:MAG: AraC family transcriptional regulator, partial [Burkholderiaceae bacterium]